MNMLSRFGPFGASVKKELWTELRYPIDFLSGLFTMFILGSWLILSAQAFSSPTQSSTSSNTSTFFAGYAIWGLVIFMFMNYILWSVANFVRHEQMQGTLEQLFLSSTNPQIALLGGAVGNIIIAIIFNLIAVFGFTTFVQLPIKNLFLAIYILGLTLLLLMGISLIFGAIILSLKRAQQVLNFSQFILMFVCAMFFPFSALPNFVRIFSLLIPISYAVDLFRTTLMGIPPELVGSITFKSLKITISGSLIEFIFLHVITFLLLGFGWWFYIKQQNRIRKKEGLGEY